jgi:DNA processing protein
MSQLHQIALTFLKNIGPAHAKALVGYMGDAEKVFTSSKGRWLKVPGIGEKTFSDLNLSEALTRAEQELEYIEKNKVEAIFYTDSRYPKRLRNCNDSPVLLYAKGPADFNQMHVVSIVGTRNATEYGKHLCRELVQELAQYKVLVVSGLALGVDVAAHKECLKLDMPTVGVLGHGLDRMYPSQNRATAEKMLVHGALLSEYPSGTIPDRENFPQRNRIVAGMADATIVIEAGIKGGALITAEIANSYNRDVFAYPGRVGDDYSEGCNFLIRNNKAQLLTCPADLAYSMDLSREELLIFNVLQQNTSPVAIDDLTIKTSLPTSSLAMNLLNMEMQGYIRALPGKVYALS